MTYEITQEITNDADGNQDIFFSLKLNGEEIGCASVVYYFEEDEDGDMVALGESRVERLDIADDMQNQGHGTYFIKEIARELGGLVAIVPDNEDAARLYDRLGRDISNRDPWSYLDVGFGVYSL